MSVCVCVCLRECACVCCVCVCLYMCMCVCVCVCFVVNFDESTLKGLNQGCLWSLWVNLFEFEELVICVIQGSM